MSLDVLTLSDCVNRAVVLLPEGEEPMVSTGADEYALLVRRICAEKQQTGFDQVVEERHIADIVDQALSRVRGDDDVFSSFEEEFGRLSNTGDRSQFWILFPLNIRGGGSEDPPETIEANRSTIRKVETSQWEEAMETAQSVASCPLSR